MTDVEEGKETIEHLNAVMSQLEVRSRHRHRHRHRQTDRQTDAIEHLSAVMR